MLAISYNLRTVAKTNNPTKIRNTATGFDINVQQEHVANSNYTDEITSHYMHKTLTLNNLIIHKLYQMQRLVGWLVFNGTFSTKGLYHAMQKLSLLQILISDRKLKYVI